MKRTAILLSITAALITGCNNPPDKHTIETKKTDTIVAQQPAPPPMDSATMMKKWQKYMTPGDMHKLLASLGGKWTAEVTMYSGEGRTPQKSTSECENKMILGGHFLERSRKSTIMGREMEGNGMIGYDNAKKMFVSSWQDNMSTGILNLEGPYDAATKTITLQGKWMDPVRGVMDVKETIKMIDDKNYVTSLFCSYGDVKDFKSMEMRLTRK